MTPPAGLPKDDRRKERAVGQLVILLWDGAKANWKTILVIAALVFNSPYAKVILENTTGWHMPGSQLQAAVPDTPVGEPWKASVDRQLKELQKQQKIIIKLLTDQ